MTRLSLEDVTRLFDFQNIPGKPWQLERFRSWIERLVANRGEIYVWENRRVLLEQWEKHVNAKFKTCV